MDLKVAMADYYKVSMEFFQGVHPFNDQADLVKEVAGRAIQECGIGACTQPL